MSARITCGILFATNLILLPPRMEAIDFGQVDTFQDGTTMSWTQGASSTNPPKNVPTGGPAGNGDKYLQNVSLGGSGPSSKMVMFNEAQWAGNYKAAGVDRITAQMLNLGSGTLYMRVALRNTAQTTIYASSAAFELPPDGNWYSISFDLTAAALTNLGGSDTLDQVLASVGTVRILSAIGGPSFSGDPVVGTLGADNIIGRDIANFVLRLTNISINASVPRVGFTTIAGRSHSVQQRSSLTTGDWSTVTNADNVTGTGGVVQVDDPDPGAGSQPHRFYRVILLPPS